MNKDAESKIGEFLESYNETVSYEASKAVVKLINEAMKWTYLDAYERAATLCDKNLLPNSASMIRDLKNQL